MMYERRHAAITAGLALALVIGGTVFPVTSFADEMANQTGADSQSVQTMSMQPTVKSLQPVSLSDEMKYFAENESGSNYDQGFSYGDGYNALGFYQFDRRYSLTDFIASVYEYNPTKYSMFAPVVERSSELMSATIYDESTGTLTDIGQLANDAWHAAYATDPAEFSALQDNFAYQEYYLPVENIVRSNYGIDLSKRPDCVKGLAWSICNLFGTGGCQGFFTAANLSDGMNDAKMVNAICDSVIANVDEYQYADSYRARYERERQTCLSYIAQHGDSVGVAQQPQEKPGDSTEDDAPEETPSKGDESTDEKPSEKPEHGQQEQESSNEQVPETSEQGPSQDENEPNDDSDDVNDGDEQQQGNESGSENGGNEQKPDESKQSSDDKPEQSNDDTDTTTPTQPSDSADDGAEQTDEAGNDAESDGVQDSSDDDTMNENEQSGCGDEANASETVKDTNNETDLPDENQAQEPVTDDGTSADDMTDAPADDPDDTDDVDDATNENEANDKDTDSSRDVTDGISVSKSSKAMRSSTSDASASDETSGSEDLPQMCDDSRITAAIGMALAGVASIAAGLLITRRN